MGQHKLSLDIPEVMNECIIRVVDTSVYDPNLSITCSALYVTIPGFVNPVEFTTLTPGFTANLTACDLELQTQDCGQTFAGLPDGIYVIRWAVSPLDTVYVEYNHLRMTKALQKYQKALCSLDLAGCEPTPKVKEKLRQLQYIRSLLDAAKAQVEFCHHPDKGMEIFKYALKLLDKINCATCH